MNEFDKQTATVADLLKHGRERIAYLDAEILLGYVLNYSRIELILWADHLVDALQVERYQQFLQRRINGEPIAYIVGTKSFWTFELQVTPDTLIPRPETELLVELALERLPSHESCQVADLGTGSGAVAIAIALERPNARILATDISLKALKIARANARSLNACIDFLQCAWLEGVNARFDLIVSNPPYVDVQDPHLNDLSYEPETALISGEQGLADLRRVAQAAKYCLKPQGILMLEHGYEQGESVRQLLALQGFTEIKTYQDIAALDRVTIGRMQDSNGIPPGCFGGQWRSTPRRC